MYIGTLIALLSTDVGAWFYHPKSGHLVRVREDGHQHGYTPDAARYSPLVDGDKAYRCARSRGFLPA